MINNFRMIGLAVGIVVGLIVCVFVFRIVNTNKKLTTDYDERQERARGKAFKYAFYAMMVYEALLCVISSGIEIPAEPLVIHFSVIFVGLVVLAIICIAKDAFAGQNTNMKRYTIVMVFVTLINILTAIVAVSGGIMVEDGKLQAPFCNLLCAVLFIVIYAAYGIKQLSDRRDD